MTLYTCDEVFGINRDIPLNYVERLGVDDSFLENLSRQKHLVIFGSSKQGKTSLRKKILNDYDYIVVHCSNKWDITELNAHILKQAGFELTVTNKFTTSGKAKVSVSLGHQLFSLLHISGEAERQKEIERLSKPIEADLSDVNDIIKCLSNIEFDQYIVIEDFHYLPDIVQRDFAIELKVFHENSRFCFIIIGVWLEEDRLIMYNGDLCSRILSINADKWPDDKLREVIEKGQNLLNISFSEDFISSTIEHSFGNVYLVQECCHRAAKHSKIFNTQTEKRDINITNDDASSFISDIINEHRGRYRAFLLSIIDGFQSTQLQMYKYLVKCIINASSDELIKGLSYKYITDYLKEIHPRGSELNPGNITQALQYITPLQIQKGIKPIIVDYDNTNLRLKVVDVSFIIWLDHQDKNELNNFVD